MSQLQQVRTSTVPDATIQNAIDWIACHGSGSDPVGEANRIMSALMACLNASETLRKRMAENNTPAQNTAPALRAVEAEAAK